jgi:hypothetical protein
MINTFGQVRFIVLYLRHDFSSQKETPQYKRDFLTKKRVFAINF